MPERLSGVLCPVVTPFDADLKPDADKLAAQCRWLLRQNVRLAVFGTNSEANSMSVDEKISLLNHLVEVGIAPQDLMPGTGCCALTDSVALTRCAVELGCAGTLMLPPFYYKGVSDDGLFASFSEVIQRIGSSDLKIYLYHIPPVAHVGVSLPLMERLVRTYPDTIVGIKDSSGDWNNTQSMLTQGWPDFRVFAGSESFLLQNMQHGGAGCISATANVNPRAIHDLYRQWDSEAGPKLQRAVNRIRAIVQAYPMIPALKRIVAHFAVDESWATVRPPLMSISEASATPMLEALSHEGFDMPGMTIRV